MADIEKLAIRSGGVYEIIDSEARAANEIINEYITRLNAADLLSYFGQYPSKSHNGVTYTWDPLKRQYTVSGNATALSFCNIFYSANSIPEPLIPGKKYRLYLDTTDRDVKVDIIAYLEGSSTSQTKTFINSGAYDYTLPADAIGILIRLSVSSGLTADNAIVKVSLCSALSNQEISGKLWGVNVQNVINATAPTSGDANEWWDSEVFFVSTPNTIENLPTTASGMMQVFRLRSFTIQVMTYGLLDSPKMSIRRGTRGANTWTDWKELSSAGTNYYNTQVVNQYTNQNTYNVSPEIKADTNNYLASSGDTTDMTAAIMAMLSETGTCHLGPGVFWVSGVDMPADSMLIGSGPATKVYLIGSDTDEGYAIKMASRCVVKDLSVLGNTQDYTSNGSTYPEDQELVQRHGIIWQGNYSTGGSSIPRRGNISGCYIANFTGGGIACYDTGLNVISGVTITDCIIWHCYAGIYIPIQSEFNRVTSTMANNCHYGVINNGGNNTFANCNFSKNIVGFMIDNSTGQSPNNSHGSMTNCVIDHSGGNTGVGFMLLGVSVGYVFTGCQLFYSKIVMNDCNGVNFIGLNAGRGEGIEITGGQVAVFADCVFRTMPSITINDNQLVKWRNCFTYAGEEVTGGTI